MVSFSKTKLKEVVVIVLMTCDKHDSNEGCGDLLLKHKSGSGQSGCVGVVVGGWDGRWSGRHTHIGWGRSLYRREEAPSPPCCPRSLTVPASSPQSHSVSYGHKIHTKEKVYGILYNKT